MIADNTALHLHGRGLPPSAAGLEAKADAVLTGRLRLVGDRLAIRAELLDTASGAPLWSERLQRPFGDVFDVEEEVTRAVARALEVELNRAAEVRVSARPTASSAAYRFYLEGKHFTYQGTPEGAERAIDRYQAALREDPAFALAHAGLSLACSWGACFEYLSTLEIRDDAVAAARRALELDPNLPEAHAALGFALCFLDWDWDAAEPPLQRAVELGPESALALQTRLVCLLNLGYLDRALELLRRAMETDPLWVKGNQDHGFLRACAGRFEEARAQLERTLELDRSFVLTRFCLGMVHLETGDSREAVAQLRKAVEQSGGAPFLRAALAHALARAGDEPAARRLVEELEGTEAEAVAVPIAWAHCALGDPDQAAKWAERGFERRSPLMVNLGWFPWWEELRDRPRTAIWRCGCACPSCSTRTATCSADLPGSSPARIPHAVPVPQRSAPADGSSRAVASVPLR